MIPITEICNNMIRFFADKNLGRPAIIIRFRIEDKNIPDIILSLPAWVEFWQGVHLVQKYLIKNLLIAKPDPLEPTIKPGNKYRILKMLDTGLSQTEAAKRLGIDKSYVHRIRKQAIADGLLTERLTAKGWLHISE